MSVHMSAIERETRERGFSLFLSLSRRADTMEKGNRGTTEKRETSEGRDDGD